MEKPKIYVPKTWRPKLVSWYHTQLQHPNIQRTYLTITRHFFWPRCKEDMSKWVETFPEFQKFKITGKKKYGVLPGKLTHQVPPWYYIYLDTIGPCKIEVLNYLEEV